MKSNSVLESNSVRDYLVGLADEYIGLSSTDLSKTLESRGISASDHYEITIGKISTWNIQAPSATHALVRSKDSGEYKALSAEGHGQIKGSDEVYIMGTNSGNLAAHETLDSLVLRLVFHAKLIVERVKEGNVVTRQELSPLVKEFVEKIAAKEGITDIQSVEKEYPTAMAESIIKSVKCQLPEHLSSDEKISEELEDLFGHQFVITYAKATEPLSHAQLEEDAQLQKNFVEVVRGFSGDKNVNFLLGGGKFCEVFINEGAFAVCRVGDRIIINLHPSWKLDMNPGASLESISAIVKAFSDRYGGGKQIIIAGDTNCSSSDGIATGTWLRRQSKYFDELKLALTESLNALGNPEEMASEEMASIEKKKGIIEKAKVEDIVELREILANLQEHHGKNHKCHHLAKASKLMGNFTEVGEVHSNIQRVGEYKPGEGNVKWMVLEDGDLEKYGAGAVFNACSGTVIEHNIDPLRKDIRDNIQRQLFAKSQAVLAAVAHGDGNEISASTVELAKAEENAKYVLDELEEVLSPRDEGDISEPTVERENIVTPNANELEVKVDFNDPKASLVYKYNLKDGKTTLIAKEIDLDSSSLKKNVFKELFMQAHNVAEQYFENINFETKVVSDGGAAKKLVTTVVKEFIEDVLNRSDNTSLIQYVGQVLVPELKHVDCATMSFKGLQKKGAIEKLLNLDPSNMTDKEKSIYDELLGLIINNSLNKGPGLFKKITHADRLRGGRNALKIAQHGPKLAL